MKRIRSCLRHKNGHKFQPFDMRTLLYSGIGASFTKLCYGISLYTGIALIQGADTHRQTSYAEADFVIFDSVTLTLTSDLLDTKAQRELV